MRLRKKNISLRFKNIVIMCTVLVSYDGRNKAAKSLINSLSTTKGVEMEYNYKKNARKNGLDEAIEDVKAGRVSKPQSFEDFKKEMEKMISYV
jgi:hypothetical protein